MAADAPLEHGGGGGTVCAVASDGTGGAAVAAAAAACVAHLRPQCRQGVVLGPGNGQRREEERR